MMCGHVVNLLGRLAYVYTMYRQSMGKSGSVGGLITRGGSSRQRPIPDTGGERGKCAQGRACLQDLIRQGVLSLLHDPDDLAIDSA